MQVIPIQSCEIAVSGEKWEWAEAQKSKIQRFWKKLHSANPFLFNGPIHMLLKPYEISDGRFIGQSCATDYASFLYWREQGFPEAGVLNLFGSGVLISQEGHLLYGRMAEHTANSGQVYPFGGSIDDGDVGEGRVAMEASILRELAEETGIAEAEVARDQGLFFIQEGHRACFAACLRLGLASRDIRARIELFLEMEDRPELDGVVVFRRSAFVAHHRMPAYARQLVEHLLP